MSSAPEPTIVVRLYGGDISPESVPVSYMAELVQAVQALSGTRLQLLKVRRGSATYALSAHDGGLADESLKVSGFALRDPDQFLQSSMLAAFDKITEIAEHFKCRCEVRAFDRRWRWNVVPKAWKDIRSRSIMQDEATITGRLIRVGGATARKCGIQVPFRRRMLICTLRNEDLARRLGRHIYSDVTLRGTGFFFARDFKLMRFRVEDFHVYKNLTFDKMYDDIRGAGGAAWDKIKDPLAELEDMR